MISKNQCLANSSKNTALAESPTALNFTAGDKTDCQPCQKIALQQIPESQ